MNISISPSFKKQTTNAIKGIVFFIIFYFALILLGIALTAGCLYAGFQIIALKITFITLILGVGVASIGVLILIFLVKFLFTSNNTDLSAYTEITRQQEPKLFAMIDDIVAQVGTDFPKKVYLSDQVNASVFYDSSFWSMFLPIRKNLHIGMGLVNSVTAEELKAVLSHEFGHFSQKSMKVGSYVYNVNHIIYNLLYDNSSYSSLAASWASVSSYFVIFVNVAFKIIEGIQWLLQKMYNLVNKNYLALSREMEFHADEVAANITGYLPLKTSLMRFDLSTNCYENVINFYNQKIDQNVISTNVFKEHTFVMQYLAKRQGIPMLNHFPEVSASEINTFQKSKLVIKNQWASHPETEERIAALEQLNIVKDNPNNEPARNLFTNADATEELLTAKLFQNVPYASTPRKLTLSEFSVDFPVHFESETYHIDFNNYYDAHNPLLFMNHPDVPQLQSFDELFSDAKVAKVKELQINRNDLATLEAIKNKSITINTFDYEGVKYKSSEVDTVMQIVNRSIEQIVVQTEAHDRAIYQYFTQKAQEKAVLNDYKEICNKVINFDALFDLNFELYNTLVSVLSYMQEQHHPEVIQRKTREFRPYEERLKESITELLTKYGEFRSELTPENLEKMNDFTSRNLTYFANDSYNEKDTTLLFEVLHLFQYINQRMYFIIKKKWLNMMLTIEGRS